MTVEQGYPVTLVHPSHKAAKLVNGNGPSEPERYPSVTVNGVAQEAQYRALGYLRFGEAPPMKIDHHEFPKTLRHPKYEAEIPARVEMRIEDGKMLGTYTIAAVPAVMPDVIVLNEDQEAKAREAGYKPAGEYNRKVLEAVLSGTVDEEAYEPQEYPKWVTIQNEAGEDEQVLIERDPNAKLSLADPRVWPKLIDGILVQDPALPPAIDPNEFPKWVHRDGKPSDESALANNPAEEAAIRDRWKPKAMAKPSAAKAEPVAA